MRQELEIKEIKIFCQKCKADMTEQGYEMLHRITGVSIDSLKNGGMNKVIATWTIGQTVLQSTGTKVVNEESAGKIVKLALEEFRKIVEPEITKEKITEIEERAKSQFWQQEQTLEQLREEVKQYKKENKELETKYNATLERIEGHLGKFLNVPAFRGAVQEKMIAKTLGAFVKEDEITREKATQEGEDVKAIIKENKQELAVVCIESKNNKKFSQEYLTDIRGYMNKHKTTYGILAVKVLPDAAQDDRLYHITEDGIWITSLEYLPFCYMAVRELVKKVKQLDVDVTRSKEEYMELLNRFRSTIESKEYRDKIISVKDSIKSLRDSSDRLRAYSKTHCDTLDKIATSIINDIASIETMNKEALGGNVAS